MPNSRIIIFKGVSFFSSGCLWNTYQKRNSLTRSLEGKSSPSRPRSSLSVYRIPPVGSAVSLGYKQYGSGTPTPDASSATIMVPRAYDEVHEVPARVTKKDQRRSRNQRLATSAHEHKQDPRRCVFIHSFVRSFGPCFGFCACQSGTVGVGNGYVKAKGVPTPPFS